jgi:glycosyltransferase involved in cell wall biosynthesis
MTAPPLISIIIPAFNQVEYCRQCLTTLAAATRPPYELILIDNGSTDGVAELFDSIEHAVVVHNPANLGFSKAINQGLERASGHPLLLNSDTLLPTGWLERLETTLFASDDIGAVGPMTNCAPGPQEIDSLELTSWQAINDYADELHRARSGRCSDTFRLVGFCMLIRDRVAKEVGLFDERFGTGNFEDDDYCLRIARAGYRLCIAEDCFVFHYGSRTFAGMGLTGDEFRSLIADNQQRLQEKWGRHVAEHSPHAHRSRQLNREARRAFKNGDAITAVRLLRDAIEAFPTLAVNHNDLGVILWQLGDKERAYHAFRRAVECDAEFLDARENLIIAAKESGREPEARALIDSREKPL